MEHTLGDFTIEMSNPVEARLNPCFSGTYSRSGHTIVHYDFVTIVLILVLVEHTLGDELGFEDPIFLS